MSNIALSGGCQRIGAKSVILPLLYPSLLNSRSASLNSAIGRGLRKSKGVGFRGREKPQYGSPNEPREAGSYGMNVRRTADTAPRASGGLTRDGWKTENTPRSENDREKPRIGRDVRIRAGKREVKDDRIPVRRSRAARFNDPDSSFGKRSSVGREKKGLDSPPEPAFTQDGRGSAFKKREGGQEFTRPKIDYEKTEGKKRAAESDRMELARNPDRTKMSKSRLAYLARESGTGGFREAESESAPTHSSYRSSPENEAFAVRKQQESERRNPIPEPKSTFRNDTDRPAFKKDGDRVEPQTSALKSKFTQTMDNRIPMSIPYTTPASEFLYGTSVVEAALTSNATPRRKLYKLYIYRGANRENEDRDRALARLAKKQDVSVEYVNDNWLRMMDKMSTGRPHNGYILEASPLPKLPVLNLGELSARDGKPGFEIVLDHQSREEAAVNGTTDFVPVHSMVKSGDGRKPFVLLLDSILDPGNLGGIIRTASFLGVTAIAISSRNSAGFTPVVLKASAGASENVTLFTVNKPAGFVTDSKAAGWKVYAAVAPTTNRTSTMPIALTTDELYNPLVEAPSILMLGNEGEGLRWNLRSKADVELSIEGSGQRGGVDSLNVSVATGILCNSFLRRGGAHTPSPRKVSREEKPTKELF